MCYVYNRYLESYLCITNVLQATMKKFQFSQDEQSSDKIFSGQIFYNVYKDAEFLRHSEHIETILSKGYELRKMLKGIAPGETVAIEGVWLEKNTPLLIRRTGPNVAIENYEFTANRLSGLAAAYAFENRQRLPIIKSSEALALGLTWDNNNVNKCRLYLSAVSGTEHFWDQFGYWPLVCGLRKLQLKKITLEPVLKIAKIKNSNGIPMGKSAMKRFENVKKLWELFPGTSKDEFITVYQDLPSELKNMLNAK